MRSYSKVWFLAICLWAAAAPASAQTLPLGLALPTGLSVDSSFRVEYLFGAQSVRQVGPPPSTLIAFDRFRFKFEPKIPVLSGTAEVSPLPWLSGRLAGSLSVGEPTVPVVRLFHITDLTPWSGNWEIKPQFNSWEAAGLVHFWNAGGYRFSATAGYRKRTWEFNGELVPEPTLPGTPGAPYREVLISQIPFVGLQTAMYFPLWKARFEVLGSAFMNKTASSSFSDGTNYVHYSTKATRGGFVECQMQGTVGLSSCIYLGVFGRFGYEEMFGAFD
ncbi:MAG: hypothetical protein HY914_17675, partial [Desulfomonile tiedjei]|nr:hypothetical protein [Desulfomonile tiedjei]